jgi:WD40 repeat protein
MCLPLLFGATPMIKRTLLALLLPLTIAGSISAQETVTTLPDNLQPITPDNADQLQEIARIGNGVFNRGIAYSPDGATLAVGGSLGIWLYDANDLQAPPTLIDLDAPVFDIEFSHDGRYLVYGSSGVHVMDFATREEVLRVPGSQFALHPDGNLLAVGRVTFEKNCETCGYFPHWMVELWSIEDEEVLRSIDDEDISNSFNFPSYIAGIAFHPDGEMMAITLSGYIDDGCEYTPKLLILLDLSISHRLQM